MVIMQSRLRSRGIQGHRAPLRNLRRTVTILCKSSQDNTSPSPADSDCLKTVFRVVSATALVYTMMGVGSARAMERAWKPRRHYRRMGEVIADDWADEAVMAEERRLNEKTSQKERAKELMRQQEEDDFKRMRMEQEQRFSRADQILSQTDASRRDLPFSIKLGGVEMFPFLFWGTVACAVFWGSKSLLQSVAGRRRGPGRWVYDRSLGGKKVWVEETETSLEVGQAAIRDAEYDRLASVAAAARSMVTGPKAFTLPSWWNPAPLPYASDSVREAKQAEADRLLSRLEQAKNRGEEYSLADILQLRSTCQEGGVSVRPKTVGARDAIYRAAVDAAVSYAQSHTEPGVASLGDQDSEFPETRLLSSLAQDLNLEEERAVGFVHAGVAAACRARLLEAVKFIKEGNEMDALLRLIKLSSLVQNLAVMEAGASAEPGLIASSLQAASKMEERQKIFYLLGQLHTEGAALYAELLGFESALVVPKLLEDIKASAEKN